MEKNVIEATRFLYIFCPNLSANGPTILEILEDTAMYTVKKNKSDATLSVPVSVSMNHC